MKKLAMKMLSLLLVLSLLLPTCVFAQPGQDGDGTPGTQGAAMEDADAPIGGGNGDEDADAPTGGGDSDEDADAPTGGGNGDEGADAPTGGGNGGEDAGVTEEPTVTTVSIAVAAEDDDISQEELLEGYLYSISGLYGEGAAVFRAPSAPLPVETQQVYDELQPMVLGVANGTGTTTEFTIAETWKKDRGASGWGIPDGDTIFTTNAAGETVLTDAASEAIGKSLDVDALMQRMLSTMPYELYWFDKTGGHGMQVTYGVSLLGSDLTVYGLKISMWVAQTYATHNGDGTYNPFTPNTTVTGATNTAVNNAKDIVNANSTKRDYQKLEAYRNKICELVSYNKEAAKPDYSGGYGDPWQLIYVFDNNGSTNVVCEGYAKAFKYLCDLTWTGGSPAVECYLVTGTMFGGTGAGPHMWNVVHIGGNNYLVDVTNCDAPAIGTPDKLFLCGVTENTKGQKYTATSAGTGMSANVVYEYDTQTMSDYTQDELTLSGTTYDPNAKKTPVITTPPTASGITYGKTLSDSTISPGVAKVDGTVVSGTFAWRDTTIAPEVKDSEATKYEVVFMPTDATSYENATCNVTLTVYAKNLTDVAVAPIADQGYNGGQITPTVTVTGDGGKTLVLNKDYTVDYGANNTVGANAGSVTVRAKSGGNYTFTDIPVSFNIKAGTSTISITGDPGKTYDGSAVTDPTVDKSGSTGAVTYTYYTDATCNTKTTTASGATPDGAAPKNAGDYWVKATVTADSNYDSATSDAKKFTIGQKPLTNSMINLGTQKTYNGTAYGPVYSVEDGGTVLSAGTDYNATNGYNPVTNVVNMTLEISGVGNYKGTAQKDWSLQKATPQVTDFTIPGLGAGYDYTGNPWPVDAPLLNSPKDGAGEVTVYYEGTSGTTYSESPVAPTDAGSYSVTFNVAEGQNFDAASGLNIGTLTINKVNYTGTTTLNETVRSNQATTDKTLALPDLPAGASYGTPTVGGTTVALISGPSVTGSMLTYSTMPYAAGTSATITIPVTGATNYNNYDVVVTVTARDKDDAGVSITNGSSAAVTYGETITIHATKTASEDGTWTWNYNTAVFDVVGANNERTITLKAKAATTTAVTVKATFDSTNYMGDASISVNVNKATPVAEDFVFTAPAVLVYNGSDKTATVTAKSGIAGMGAVTVKYFKDGSLATDTKAAGTYVVKVDVAAGTNYAAISDLTADEWTFTVTRANASVTTAPAAVGGLGYDGSAKNLITAGTCTGGTMNYRLGDSGAWGATIPQATNAGTYTVWYKVVGDSNHNDTAAASVTVTIARQSITPSVTVSGSYTYNNGNPITPTVEVKNGGATLTAGTDYDMLVSDNTNAGTGKVTVKERADSNYTFTEVQKTFSIGRANQATLTVTGGTSVVYGETLTLGTSGGSGTGAVTYTVTDVTGKATITGNVLTPTQAGTVKVKATKAADTNYNAIDSAEVEITIAQATPTGAPKFTKITSSGKTLGDAALVKTVSGPGDGFSVAGTVEWVDGSTALADSTSVEANKSYEWKFTPTDSNYKSISGAVVVYTVRRVSHSGGAAADSAAAAAQPMVYSGSRGESVKTLQAKLNAKGFNAGSVDGIFGKNTRAAVMAFQKANGLAADGIVGKLTWAKLYDTTAALPAESTATGTQPMVYRGSRGDAVRKLQELLNKKGFDCGAADGIFGSKTYAAVVAFQKANGLSADGIAGPLTWGKLG